MSTAKAKGQATPDKTNEAARGTRAPHSSLASLKAMGAVVDAAPIPRDITFTLDDGVEQTFTIFVRRMSIGEAEKVLRSSTDHERSQYALIISSSVSLGENGSEVIPYTTAYQFHPALANAMVDAVNEVNGNVPKKS